jgi:CRISPR-associated endonuclease/helicase Cas3
MSATPFYAHSPNAQGHWHLFDDHVAAVARLAASFAAAFGEERAAEILGFWHDIGKLNPQWQARLIAVAANAARQKIGIPHADVGFAALMAINPSQLWPLAMLVDCHHRGLYNAAEVKARRLAAQKEPHVAASLPIVTPLMQQHCDPSSWTCAPVWDEAPHSDGALRMRMLHACLVDADCLDTAGHDDPTLLDARDLPDIPTLRDQLRRAIAAKQASAPDTLVNRHRAAIAEDAVRAAALAPGFFSLTVPTGGGKTLCGMSFGLEHAALHGLRRVIVAIPYTSIIEQNAAVYRDIFGDDAVLEHHSAVDEPDTQGEDPDDARRQRLATLRWDAPIVVTTHVQLLESLFSNRNSKLRKLHHIAHSVIILDEVQTLPPALLAPTLHMLSALVRRFGCSIVFSTATQPAFTAEILADKRPVCHLDGVREIIAAPDDHFAALRRVDYTFVSEPLGWDEVAARVRQEPSALVICNTVKDAHALVRALEVDEPDGLMHLSTRLCGAHRREVLDAVRARLASGLPCLLISTQVVEAGVDLDFPCVWRALGPLDGIIQAAGRCNREGALPSPGRVVIFQPVDGHCPPGAYASGRDATAVMWRAGQLTAQAMHTPAICRDYFKALYGVRELDAHKICEAEERWAFADSARDYKLIADDMTPVLIQRAEASAEEQVTIASILARVRHVGLYGRHMRALQPFLVSLRRRDLEAAQRAGLITQASGPRGAPQPLYLWGGGYDARLGLVLDPQSIDPTSLIIA